MINVFIKEILKDVPIIEILYPNLANSEFPNVFGEKLFTEFKEPLVKIVNDISEADYILVPHHFNYIKKKRGYLNEINNLSVKYNKKVIIFFPGDSDEYINLTSAIIFRNSQYRYKKLANEIIIPGYAKDLSSGQVQYREKGEIPVVGFCGWAGLNSLKQKTSYFLKNILLSKIHRKGIYFRKKAISVLENKPNIKTNFIIRNTYTANKITISVDPVSSRNEYINNIIDSDLILAPKGDGNFSVRFYEALSLGRIPLLIDTQCPLPLEDEIDYSKFILKVDYRDLNNLDKIVDKFWRNITNNEYLEMQKTARKIFEEKLSIDVFLKYMFSNDNLSKYVRK